MVLGATQYYVQGMAAQSLSSREKFSGVQRTDRLVLSAYGWRIQPILQELHRRKYI